MKKNSFTEFFKGKGYYVLLFVGMIAIGAVGIVGSQLASKKDKQENSVDINDVDDNIKAEVGDLNKAENNQISEGIVKNEGDSATDVAANDEANELAENDGTSQDIANSEDMIEYEGYAEGNQTNVDNAVEYAETDAVAPTEDAAVETGSADARNETAETLENLSFNADDGLMWPVMGNVIMNYSMDHTIYFATMMQYKCNPAVILDAEVGAEVKAAATGVVTDIVENEETGLTVTMDIGDNYSVVYGQLTDCDLEVGDLVQEGSVFAKVDEPSKYYSVEGSNLYLMVMKEEETVNPMLLLR